MLKGLIIKIYSFKLNKKKTYLKSKKISSKKNTPTAILEISEPIPLPRPKPMRPNKPILVHV